MPVLRTLSSVLACLVLFAAAPLQAQRPAAAVPDTVRVLLQELRGLQSRLDSAQTLALRENPQLQERREAIERYVTEVMVEAHPDVEQKLERLPELQQEILAAREARDTAQLMAVVQEGRRIQAELQNIRDDVMERGAVQERVGGFRRDLLVAMGEVDPEVDAVVDRLEDLARKLQGLQPGG